MSASGTALRRLLDRVSAAGPDELAGRIVRIEPQPPCPAVQVSCTLPDPLPAVLTRRRIDALYTHQARALEAWERGDDVLLATGTASGKSLVYNLAIIRRALAEPGARALLVFPLKALERDQLAGLQADFAALPGEGELSAEIYDGDTSPYRRKKIREAPPTALLTNPDMLHSGILAQHALWRSFFEKLRLIVIDEVHTYRGVLGAHVAQVLRRLLRIARLYGAEPQVIACSATVGNPASLARALWGRPATVVDDDGAPRPARSFVFVDPEGSPYTTAVQLFRRCVREGLRTIAFTQARRITELMHTWIAEGEPALAKRISSYRSGFLPEERRQIEQRLFSGELLGVISTSALELGIDVGGLDVCILVGYPGSVLATRQRAGRVARGREGLVFVIPQHDALDRYFLAHPRALLERPCEDAVLDPANPEVVAAHLPCAGAERPLVADEPWLAEEGVRRAVELACERGDLLESAAGGEYFPSRSRPHHKVSLRSVGESYTIRRETKLGRGVIGTVGGGRAFAECHEGAIYLHGARSYEVLRLDLERCEAIVRGPVRVDHYTRALGEKDTEILEISRTRPLGNVLLREGRLKITQHTTHYEKRRTFGQDILSKHPLDLPPQSYETEGLWIELAPEIETAIAMAGGHFMGAIHGLEHAALALLPLFALCDRFDVAGISVPRHPQVRGPAVFLYDGAAGGLGICRTVFPRIEELLEATGDVVARCECLEGCPSCIHSPRCGSGNRPLDKHATASIVPLILGKAELPVEASVPDEPPFQPSAALSARPAAAPLIFDVETQRSAKEVGGWHNTHLMRVAVAVVYDVGSGEFTTYHEDEVEDMLERMFAAPAVIGFNSRRFDYGVLRAYTARNLDDLASFDLLEDIHARLGYRLSLDHLGQHTLGRPKTADGLQSLAWWRDGEVDKVEAYCRADVALVRDLIDHATREGHVLFQKKKGPVVRLAVDWSPDAIVARASSAG